MLDQNNKNVSFKDNAIQQDVKASNLNNSIGKLFEQFSVGDEYKINMEDRICMHCWIVKSTLYCSTCMCFYCASCAHMNHVSAGSYHDIISVHHLSISRTDTAKSLQEKQKNLCKRHKNKELTYCCTSCNYMLICETCIIIDGHGSHLLLTFAEAVPRGRQILLQSLSSLNAASFYMSQKISEISALAEQRKTIFENNLLNVEDTQKSLTKAITSEEQLLFTELNLLASKLDRGGKDICKSCVDLKEMLVSVCGEVSIILQLAKESPSHSLNRYVKISHVVKGTLDPTYRVLVPELQHLSVPYWNLFPEIIDDVLNDTNKYTQEHIDHAMKLSDAITKIASGDISVVEDIGPINVQVYAKNSLGNDRSVRAKVHKIFTSKLKMIQHEKLKNIQNPLIAPKSSLKLESKAKAKSKAAQTGPKLQEWLGLRDWKNNQSKKQGSVKKNLPAFMFPNKGGNDANRRRSVFDNLEMIRALSDGDIQIDQVSEKDIEIMTIGRDKKLETAGRPKEEKLQTEEFYESQVHFTGTLFGACTFTRKEDGTEVLKLDEDLMKINLKYCFPFIIIYDARNSEDQNSNGSSLKKNSNIMDKAHSVKGRITEYTLPTISPGLERIDIPIVLGKVERPRNSLFVADVRQSNIRIQSIHSNSITPETSKFLGAISNSSKPIEDGFEISNVIRGSTIDSWVFSCADFNTAEKWISMLKGEDMDVKSCIQKIGTARLCIKSLASKRANAKISKSKLTENRPGVQNSGAYIDVVPKIPDNTREKLLISAQPDHHDLTQTIIYEDDEGEYYEEQEIDLPDVMSIRLDRKLSAKKTKSLEKLMIPSILKIGNEPVIQIEKLHVIGTSLDQKSPQVVALTKTCLYITSVEIFEKNISHDLLLDEYSIQKKCFVESISILDPSNHTRFSMISPKLMDSRVKEDGSVSQMSFGFEYKEDPHHSTEGVHSSSSRSIITFVCPTKDSELIWLNSIQNCVKKKPLKYWRQILDGTISRHRRIRSPKSPKGSKLSKSSSSSLSQSRRRSSINNFSMDESERFTDTSMYIQKSEKEQSRPSHTQSHNKSSHESGTEAKGSSGPTTTHSEGPEPTNLSDYERRFRNDQLRSRSNLDSSGRLSNSPALVRFNINAEQDIGASNPHMSKNFTELKRSQTDNNENIFS